ncbi:MAG: glycosyltransferase family A protein [Limisphaerales bacterium]
METPSLTVIVPNYNHAALLPRCLDAVLAQTLQPLEVIVIDDCSTDSSWTIIQDYARRNPVIQAHRNEQNRGVIYGVNRGIELARGEYLYFAPADDETRPTLFEKSFAILRQHPEAALCCTVSDFREVPSGMNWHVGVGMADRPCYLAPERLVELERQGKLHIAPNTSVIRRAALIRAGQFVPELKWHSDWFGFYVAAFRGGACFVPEPLAIFYVHPTSYFKAGSQQALVHQEVLRNLMARLTAPACADVIELIRRSGALYIFGWPLFKILRATPAYRRFLTPNFLRKNLWHACKLAVKRWLPVWLANLYFRVAGYRSQQP